MSNFSSLVCSLSILYTEKGEVKSKVTGNNRTVLSPQYVNLGHYPTKGCCDDTRTEYHPDGYDEIMVKTPYGFRPKRVYSIKEWVDTMRTPGE